MIRRLAGLPQVWLVLFALAGAAAGRLLPFELPPVIRGAGFLLLLAGGALMLWAAAVMRAARTSFMPGQSPDALVTGGPFRFSRNPIYLGDVIALAGLMLALSAPAGLVLVPAFALLLERRFIRHEEKLVAAAIGPAYDRYRARVRRWL
ncbi:Protein-S-isoprenylcysteine O-methyltransferase Ste14 [Paracoccus halophilus]|uniref:Isoprenylcysteine carboxyl methyltransferase n=1 Tax=Paracoccus halophilus TaxID=376733 RepID=A0A099F5Z2_9RHOB|nr:isoprenylcysteine carboxylmethyltransferase family protein [Paracoccus halophilus]KGJ06155.1 isoprenylcysteine carboxyl methyltransferase [Paracoccus halophilus]SFA46017.1 Protein-S-isoprenylcysteine O-methyltransferase Ste14 [Paracoccus halophilus]